MLRDMDSPNLYILIKENEEIVVEVESKFIAISRRNGDLYTKLLSSDRSLKQVQ